MSNEKTINTSTGNRVILTRKNKSLSQQEFADILGVSRSYIGDIERSRCEPSSNFLTLLSSKLNVNADWVLTGDGEMYKNAKNENFLTPRKKALFELVDTLTDEEQQEIFLHAADKKRMRELEAIVAQLQRKAG